MKKYGKWNFLSHQIHTNPYHFAIDIKSIHSISKKKQTRMSTKLDKQENNMKHKKVRNEEKRIKNEKKIAYNKVSS